MSTCLVLSESQIPLPGLSADGGGLRAWGLARGLSAQTIGFHVTVAYPRQDGFPDRQRHLGVDVRTWTPASLAGLLAAYDSVIVSYCAAGLAPAVVDALRADQQLILDCNVPFHVEVSARDGAAPEDEHGAFVRGLPDIARVLQRGDIFLCASDRQKLYYTGVLAALGRVNPATYGSDLLVLTPYGIEDAEPEARCRPIDALTRRPESTKLLWFGSLYPWFDIAALLEAVALLNERGCDTTLTVVGARNPKTTHPDFLANFDAFDRLVSIPRYRAHTFVQPWVEFDDRADWYLDADLGVTLNRPGLENHLAWRTRLVDMVWSGLPVASNAGDPLGDALMARGAAIQLDVTDPSHLADRLESAVRAPDTLHALRGQLAVMREELRWPQVTAALAAHIRAGTRAADFEPRYVAAVRRHENLRATSWRRAARRLVRFRDRIRHEGLGVAFGLIRSRLRRAGRH